MVKLRDTRILEASGLAVSTAYSNLAYVISDEYSNPQVFGVSLTTGNTTATFSLRGLRVGDPEALGIDAIGKLVVCDTGDNDFRRTDCSVTKLDQPGTGNHGTLDCAIYRIRYPKGPVNVETYLCNPINGKEYLVTKEAGGARVYRLPDTMYTDRRNTVLDQKKFLKKGKLLSDGCFSKDGKWIFFRSANFKDRVLVFKSNWSYAGDFGVPKMVKPESISMSTTQNKLWIGSEGKNSPLLEVSLPSWCQES